ncbi:MAG TPA: TIGR01777 family oxidoreductase [Gemmatimonadales bacterium]|jgi:hypothetical protein
MRVAITGATGFLGTALTGHLAVAGHDVIRISRRPGPGTIVWDPDRQTIDTAPLERCDAVIHLAGENLASGRWTTRRKAALRASRVPVTAWLSSVLAQLAQPPQLLITASAVGIYGDRGDDLLDESSPPGDDFLAHLAADWEGAADPARAAGIRVVHTRFGIILDSRGGALAKMLPVFRLGIGGRLGSGRQWMSWIALEDVVHAVAFIMQYTAIAGAVNVVSPEPVRNATFAHALGAAVHRPAIVPAPAFALRLVLGEVADAALLASQRASPAVLQAHDYPYRVRSLPQAFAEI